MAEEKSAFCWPKLKETHLNSVDMMRLRNSAGGKVFTIIYLKMRLASLLSGGSFESIDLNETQIRHIAWLIGEDEENVANAIAIFRRYNLI